LNKTQHKQKTPFSDSEYLSHLYFSKRQKESIEDPSVELSHGSGTCLPQESKGSGTLSGSKAETNDDAASTSRSKSIQPNNLDLAFDKSNVDYQLKTPAVSRLTQVAFY
jgi:hypothetical protein